MQNERRNVKITSLHNIPCNLLFSFVYTLFVVKTSSVLLYKIVVVTPFLYSTIKHQQHLNHRKQCYVYATCTSVFIHCKYKIFSSVKIIIVYQSLDQKKI